MFPSHARQSVRRFRRPLFVPLVLVSGVLLVAYPPKIPAAQAVSRTPAHLPASVRDGDPQPTPTPSRARANLVCVINIVNNQKVNNVQRVVTVQNNKQKVVTVQKVVIVPHFVTVTKVVYVPHYITKVVYVPRYLPAPTATPYDPAAAAYNATMAPYGTPTPTPTDTPAPYPPVAYP